MPSGWRSGISSRSNCASTNRSRCEIKGSSPVKARFYFLKRTRIPRSVKPDTSFRRSSRLRASRSRVWQRTASLLRTNSLSCSSRVSCRSLLDAFSINCLSSKRNPQLPHLLLVERARPQIARGLAPSAPAQRNVGFSIWAISCHSSRKASLLELYHWGIPHCHTQPLSAATYGYDLTGNATSITNGVEGTRLSLRAASTRQTGCQC